MPTLVACLWRRVEAIQPGRVPTYFGPATRLRRPESQWNQGALATSQVEMCPRTANSGQCDLADVVGDLAAGPPQAGAGVLAPGKAGDPGGAGAPLPPLRREPTGDREQLDPTMLLATVTAAVDRRVPVEGVLIGAQAREGVVQARLVGLDPDQESGAGVRRAREGFFWPCRASAVNRTPRTPRAPSSAWAAAISSPSAIS